MKILTKDGQDVTNTASRGSKTKEQRDHAHLMRIIKACESCRRKKIRCDPSHKKRGAAQVAAQPVAKPAKKARTVSQDTAPCPLPASSTDANMIFSSSSFFDLESSFDFSGLDNLDSAALPYDPFEEFVQFPPMDTSDIDFLLETGDYVSSQATTTASSSSAASPLKSLTPSSQQDPGVPFGTEFVNPDLQESSSNFPFLERSGSSSDYTDFNLFSPGSSFSEDERMLPIGSSTSSLPSINEPSISECPPPSYEGLAHGEAVEWDGPGLSTDELKFHSASESIGGSGQIATTSHALTASESAAEYGSSPIRVPGARPLSQLVICCPPGTVVVAGDTSPGGSQIPDNVRTPACLIMIDQRLTSRKVSTDFNSSAASVSVHDHANVRPLSAASPWTLMLTPTQETPGVFVDQSVTNATSSEPNRIRSVCIPICVSLYSVWKLTSKKVLPAQFVGQPSVFATNSYGIVCFTISHYIVYRAARILTSKKESPAESVHQPATVSTNRVDLVRVFVPPSTSVLRLTVQKGIPTTSCQFRSRSCGFRRRQSNATSWPTKCSERMSRFFTACRRTCADFFKGINLRWTPATLHQPSV
jgi:hypothetical protein